MLPQITFPLDVQEVIKLIPNCRYMSYQKFAKINNCSINDVIQMCESKSGCTHYDISQNRYLILCNQSTQDNNNFGRQLWTCSHEIGHILCKHHSASAYSKLSENSFMCAENPEFENEADSRERHRAYQTNPLKEKLMKFTNNEAGKKFGVEDLLKW